MPAKTLEEVLATLSGPEKTLFETTLKNNSELRDGWLRQDDYSRNSQELQSRKAEYDEQKAYNERMTAWADRNVPKWDSLVEKGYIDDEGNELFSAQKTALESKLAEAEAKVLAGGGTEMDAAELKERVSAIVKESGLQLSKEELSNLVQNEAKKMVTEGLNARLSEETAKFNENTVPFVAGFSAAVAVTAAKYERETGKPWTAEDQKALFETMNREKNFDPFVMGEKYLEPHRKAKGDEAEIERKANERAEALIKERGLMPGGGREDYIPQLPGQKGNVAKMLERDNGAMDFETLINSQAVKAAEALRTEGK